MDEGSTRASPQALLAHAEWIRRLARALVRQDEGDDVVQQTYALALAAPRPSRNLRGWLGAIVRNVVRRRKRDDATRARHEALAPFPGHAPDPVQAVARAELHRRVVDAVLALDEPYRSTLVLRFFEERPADEIARALVVPVETVRTRVKRGLAQVRARLGGEFARAGGSLMEGLALLLVPRVDGGGGGGGAGDFAKAWTTAGAGVGAGVLVMTTSSKLLIATAMAVVVVAAAWRLTAPKADVHARAAAPLHAAAPLPPPASAAEQAVAEPMRALDDVPEPAASTAASAPDGDAATFVCNGRVVDEKGDAVEGATVLLGDAKVYWAKDRKHTAHLVSPLLDWGTKPEAFNAHATRSANDGTFRFEGVDAYQASVVAAIHETAGIGLVSVPARKNDSLLVVTLAPMIVVLGHVTDIHGHVPSPARIDVGADFGEPYSEGFDLPVRPDGSFRYFAVGLKSATFTAVAEDGRKSDPVHVDFGAGQPLQRTIDFVLGASTGPCHGRIVDAGGEPLDLRESLLPRLLDRERTNGGERAVRLFACRGATAPPAKFSLGAVVEFGVVDLAGATYSISLPAEARWLALVARDTTIGSVEVVPGTATTNGPDLVVDLTQLPSAPTRAQIEVRIVGAEDGAPYSGAPADVVLQSIMKDPDQPSASMAISTSASRQDDAAATFWFDGVEPSHCTITIMIEGMVTIRRTLDVIAREKPYEIEVTARPADAELRGLVVDPHGRPVGSARVRWFERTATGLDLTSVPPTLTNDEGRFRFEKLASGEGVVIVHALPFAPAVVPVKIAGATDAGSIGLAAGGRVVVTVARARGDPSQSSFASLHVVRTEDGMTLADAAWDGSVDWKTSTRFDLVLPSGRATLALALVDGTELQRELDVVAGRSLDVAIE